MLPAPNFKNWTEITKERLAAISEEMTVASEEVCSYSKPIEIHGQITRVSGGGCTIYHHFLFSKLA